MIWTATSPIPIPVLKPEMSTLLTGPLLCLRWDAGKPPVDAVGVSTWFAPRLELDLQYQEVPYCPVLDIHC